MIAIGLDPYHDDNQAHGLCFSVKKPVRAPPSLKNMFKLLETDIPGFVTPNHGYLESWARQGVLMVNASMTVRAHQANSHKGKGWEKLLGMTLFGSTFLLSNVPREKISLLTVPLFSHSY